MSTPNQTNPQDLRPLSDLARRLLAAHDKEVGGQDSAPAAASRQDQAA